MEKKWLHYHTTPEEVKRVQDVLDRSAYRAFKALKREDMAVVLARIYHSGIEEAKRQALERTKARMDAKRLENGDISGTVDADDIVADIMQIKGIGEKLGGEIAHLFEAYAEANG